MEVSFCRENLFLSKSLWQRLHLPGTDTISYNISRYYTPCETWEGRNRMNSENGLEKQKLLIELENIRNRGIMIFLDGIPSSPLTVTDVLCVNESSDFMRDYVTDEKGVWTELRFDRIKPT